MLEEIIQDKVSSLPASNQDFFSKKDDYAALVALRDASLERWKSLSSADKRNFKGLNEFQAAENIPNLKDPILAPARSYYLLSREAAERIKTDSGLSLVSIDAIDFDDSALELAESIENAQHIRDLYRLRKKTSGADSGINIEEATKIKNCFTQGRELYLAGRAGSLMVKPLNFFYSLTAYAYGVIILNNPIRFGKGNLPGSHGMAYLPNTVQAQFGGDTARGTFSDLVTSFPTQIIRSRSFEIQEDCTESIVQLYANRFNVSLGSLLSLVPEMSEYYKLVTGRPSRAHPLEIVNANDARSLKWEFQVGDGEVRPPIEEIKKSFEGFELSERHGKYIIQVPATDAHRLHASVFTDTKGKFWYIENIFPPLYYQNLLYTFL